MERVGLSWDMHWKLGDWIKKLQVKLLINFHPEKGPVSGFCVFGDIFRRYCVCVHVWLTEQCTADTTILQMAVDARRAAEVAAKQMLCHVDSCSSEQHLPCVVTPWEELSSSRTTRYLCLCLLLHSAELS